MADLGPDEAAVHQESLRLLAEASEYLGRLPSNALTRDLKTKIEAHLKRPGAKAQIDRLEAIAKDQEWSARLEAGNAFTGVSRFLPTGLPVIQCLVTRGVVNLRSPLYEDAIRRDDSEGLERFAGEIGRNLGGGLKIELRPLHAEIDRPLLKPWLKAI